MLHLGDASFSSFKSLDVKHVKLLTRLADYFASARAMLLYIVDFTYSLALAFGEFFLQTWLILLVLFNLNNSQITCELTKKLITCKLLI